VKAKAQCINYIKEKLGLISSKPIQFISVTYNEAQLQLVESLLKKEEIVFVIEILVESLNEAKQPQFKGLKLKGKKELLIILQQV
ncbi:4025_t:CDS:1, partial [Dentiscutata heterogama]